jgi:hypothetical protein
VVANISDGGQCKKIISRKLLSLFIAVYILVEIAQKQGMRTGFWWESKNNEIQDNIKMDLREIVWGSMDWINLAQDREQCRALVITVMNLRVP